MTNLADQVVATDRGKLRGSDEGAVVSFRGIPYAASPVGAARFAAPHTHPGWTGVREAVRPGPAVPQAPSRLERVMGTRRPDWAEDGCLTLNVWAPRPALEEKAPVRFWSGSTAAVSAVARAGGTGTTEPASRRSAMWWS